jgi:SAM-dependent methyltransferase
VTDAALAARVDALIAGYLPATVVFAAVELGVFEALAAPRTFGELAARLGAQQDGVARLCRALCALGLVAVDGDRVSASADARAVFADGAAAVARFHRRQLLPPLLQLADAVRTGRPQHAAWPFAAAPVAAEPYAELARHPDELRAVMLAMDAGSVGVGAAIARHVELARAALVVDIGCGGGVVARELLRALPALRVHSIDAGAAACAVARERSAAEGLAARHDVVEGDARRGAAVRDADAVVVSAILADFPRDERVAILRGARDALRPGGRVIVSETLLDDDRAGPVPAVLLSLVMLTATRGDQLSAAQVTDELAAAGFVAPAIHRGPPRDLVVATRP